MRLEPVKHGLEMMHPEFKLLSESESEQQVEDSLTPVYPTTEGVKQITLRNISEQALAKLDTGILADLLPEGMYQQQIGLAEGAAHCSPTNAGYCR